ncbi:hypothetical protein ACFFRE_02925 [Aciditerrimonas ferrireducens]|uniref:Uncharacterized protein n=1 Tax=Aciditerrimonas ferrireducens TaxID=667306 RepID=A0ABV6C099_9ACTN
MREAARDRTVGVLTEWRAAVCRTFRLDRSQLAVLAGTRCLAGLRRCCWPAC